MANVKISELGSATTPLGGTELIEIVQGGVNKKVAVSEVGGGATPDLEAVLTEGNESTLPIIINGTLTEQVKLIADIDGNTGFGLTSIDILGNYSKFTMPIGGADGIEFALPARQIGGGTIATETEIKDANFTAEFSIHYIIKDNTVTVTDGGIAYTVFVESGTAVIGGVSYGSESLVYRILSGGVWNSTLINSSGATNLGYTASPTNGIVTSDTGTDATIPLADTTDAGLLAPADKTKLDAIPILASGTYTPTGTIIANLDSISWGVANYMRVGSVVTVSGEVTFDPTTGGGTLVNARFTLPIASAFANTYDCNGGVFPQIVISSAAVGGITANVANDQAEIKFPANFTSSQTFKYHYQYTVI